MTPAERTKQTKQVITSPRSWIPKSAVTTNHGWQPFQVPMLHGILKTGSAHPFPWNSANHELSPSVLDQASVPPFRGMSLEWHLTLSGRESAFSGQEIHLLAHDRNNSLSSGQWSKKKNSNEMNATENVAGSVPSTSLTTAALASSCLTCTLQDQNCKSWMHNQHTKVAESKIRLNLNDKKVAKKTSGIPGYKRAASPRQKRSCEINPNCGKHLYSPLIWWSSITIQS